MAGKGDGNRAAMRDLAEGSAPPGVVGYLDGTPVAWCGFGHRSDFPRMQRSSLLKPVDDEQVVSLTCLFVKRSHRGKGLCSDLIVAVCGYLAETAEAQTVEAYPVEPADGRKAGADNAMTGIASAFRAAGFTEIARPRSERLVMRYSLR
nr:GNAT family N-acetyltransferase [Phytoactinopolyspora mesophila]